MQGTWTATSRRENATVIREEYFERSWNLIASFDSKNKADVAIRYARFADDQYQQTSSRVSEIDQLESYTRKKEGELAQLVNQTKNSQSSSSELRGRRRADEAMSQQDRQVISNFRSARRSLLESAVTMYSHALAHSDGNADAIYRLCSLWLSNFEDDGFCANARKAITSIPSHCFIPLVPQLSARLAALNGEDKSPFQRTLQTVVEHLAVEHPFHSLFQLYFLYNTGAGTNSQPKATQKRRSSGNYTTTGLISEMLSRLRQTSSLRETMLSIEQAIAAYAEWAGMKVEKQRPSADRMRPMPKTLKLLTLKHMRIPVSTVSIPVDKTCTYKADEMPCIVGYKKTYTTAGGINLPKITDCIGSDGKTYRQLVSIWKSEGI